MGVKQKIAVLCNYELLPERVGGMDYFFWLFDKKCKENNIEPDWFFPNTAEHGDYRSFTIFDSGHRNVETFFLENHTETQTRYYCIITHFAELCTPFYKEAKKVSGAKIIAVDHNPRPINGYPFRKRIEKRVKGILYSRYIDLFVGVSNYTVSEILKDFGKSLSRKTITIYNGVVIDNIEVNVKRNAERPTFLVASHLRESKGIQDLIAAVSLLPESIKAAVKIDIYGDGPYQEILKEMVAGDALEPVFTFFGSRPDLDKIFCRYDYMLQPTHMECFSLSILESLAANVPVITTNVGGNEEAVVNGVNGFIFEAKNVEALSRIIADLYSGRKKITGNTRNGVASAFSLEQMADNHIRLILPESNSI